MPVSVGVVPVGSRSAPLTVVITNDEKFSYTIQSLGLTDPSFLLLANGCSGVLLAPGGSCSFTLVFAPKVGGPATASVSTQLSTVCGTRRDYFPCSYEPPAPGIGQGKNFSVLDLPGGLRIVRWTPDSFADRTSRNGVTFTGVGVT